MDEREGKRDFIGLIRKLVELAMPDLRSYYRMTRKAKIVGVYAADGQYFADVQPLWNDESVDDSEPVVPRVALPVLWGGPDRGLVCPPTVGTLCDLSFYDGDPNYPFISNIRYGLGQNAPKAELNELVIQLEPGGGDAHRQGKTACHAHPGKHQRRSRQILDNQGRQGCEY